MNCYHLKAANILIGIVTLGFGYWAYQQRESSLCLWKSKADLVVFGVISFSIIESILSIVTRRLDCVQNFVFNAKWRWLCSVIIAVPSAFLFCTGFGAARGYRHCVDYIFVMVPGLLGVLSGFIYIKASRELDYEESARNKPAVPSVQNVYTDRPPAFNSLDTNYNETYDLPPSYDVVVINRAVVNRN